MKLKTAALKNALRVALFAALTAAVSQLALPLPSGVPVTFQVFAIGFCSFFAGVKNSLTALAVYVALGAVGVPVFAGFKGGISCIAGPTGGFIIGFFILCFFCAVSVNKRGAMTLLLSAVGLLLFHSLGAFHFSLVSGVSFINAVITVSLFYIPKDAVLLIAAFFCAKKALKIIKE